MSETPEVIIVPDAVVATKTTEDGVVENTIAGEHGYVFLRSCVEVLKAKSFSDKFSKYSFIKDNRTSTEAPKNKTPESRKQAYGFAAAEAIKLDPEVLIGIATEFLTKVDTNAIKEAESLAGEVKRTFLLERAATLAAGGYNRLFSPGANTIGHNASEDGEGEDEDEEMEDICPECHEEACSGECVEDEEEEEETD